MRRVLTAAALIPFVVYLVLFSPFLVLRIAVFGFAALCFREYARMVAVQGFSTYGAIGYVAGASLMFLPGDAALLLTVFASLALTVSMSEADLAKALPSAGALVLGVVYVFGSWRCAMLLRDRGSWWLLYALVITWVGDSCAYFVGRWIGKNKMAPRVSPGKSWEGAAASVVGSVIFGVVYVTYLEPAIPRWQSVLLAAGANVAGQMGDLVESALKRGAGVKDSGTLLPGHGGMLDRVDSSLFSMPFVYLFLKQLG